MNNYKSYLNTAAVSELKAFIHSHWKDTIRRSTEDVDSLLGLPHPYSVPSRSGSFQEMYYWDTYFTCCGLIDSGLLSLAKSNTLNLLAQVKRFGFVPNGNRTFYLKRSQPPYLASLVQVIAANEDDASFLKEAIPILEQEYQFWITQRTQDDGLACYGNDATRDELIEFFATVELRLELDGRPAEDCLEEASKAMSECESGWDFNHRFEHRCPDFYPVDLNSNLYHYEILLAEWTSGAASEAWSARAERRKELINHYCWDEARGTYFDYDHVNQKRGTVLSVATFQPLWVGLANEAQAEQIVNQALPLLECPYGIAAAEKGTRDRACQWDYPNGWPCLQYLTYRSLDRYGYKEDARRIAEKYISTTVRNFALTGDLWEKYNVLDGTTHGTHEAGYLISPIDQSNTTETTPAMMGWTAGVVLDAINYIN